MASPKVAWWQEMFVTAKWKNETEGKDLNEVVFLPTTAKQVPIREQSVLFLGHLDREYINLDVEI